MSGKELKIGLELGDGSVIADISKDFKSAIIVDLRFPSLQMPFNTAVQYCDQVPIGKMAKWEMASEEEIRLVFENLKDTGLLDKYRQQRRLDLMRHEEGFWTKTTHENNAAMAVVIHPGDSERRYCKKTKMEAARGVLPIRHVRVEDIENNITLDQS